MTQKSDYTVTVTGRVAGKWHAAGDTVSLTPAQAKYEHVTPVVSGPVEAPVEAPIEAAVTEAAIDDSTASDTVTGASDDVTGSSTRRSKKAGSE